MRLNLKYKLLFGFLLLSFSVNFLIYCKNEINQESADKKVITIPHDSTDKTKQDTRSNLKDLYDVFQLHYDASVIDTHNDFLYQVFNKGADLGRRDNYTFSGLPRFKDGGVDMQVFAVWIPGSESKRAFTFANEQIARLKAFENKYSNDFEIAYCYEDVVRIMKEKKFCGMLGIEDGVAVLNDVDNVNILYESGVRYIGLTWNKSNKIGSSARDESEKGIGKGLTDFGKQVVTRMEDLGMLVDVSHSGEKTFWDVIEMTQNPVIASHSNCYALNPHYRNLKDDQIIAIAKTGGVIMVNFLDDFINQNGKFNRVANYKAKYGKELDNLYNEYKDDLITFNVKRYEFMKAHPIDGGTSLDDLIDHIDHIKSLVGINHIGIGSDFDGGIVAPNEIYDATCYPVITARLWERGYTEEEIRKILGENFLRVLKQVCSK